MMNTLIILLVTFYLTISDSLSKPSHHDDGFTFDLIHRDSPLSPLYNHPTSSLTDRRAFRRAGFVSSKIDVDISNTPVGGYIMKFQIGTPPIPVFLAVSTVSDFVWTQCKPCKKCHKQHVGVSFFVPGSSSTYRAQSCQSKACKVVLQDNMNSSSCDKHNETTNNINVCRFEYSYERGPSIKGVLGTDTFWFGQTPLRNVLFGCVDDYEGENSTDVSGIIGLGGAPFSFINQLKPLIHGKFSYCLTAHGSNQTSKIYFGDRATVSGPNVVSTSLVKKKDFETFYYVNLIDVVVGNKNHSSSSTYNDQSLDHIEYGNMVVDFSWPQTLLPQEIYDRISTSLMKAIGGETVGYDHPEWLGSICYKDLNLDRVPVVTFEFIGADVKVPPENMFLEVEKGLSCLTIQAIDDSLGWFGSLFQRNLMVGFDLVKQKVYFKPTNCAII